MAVCGSQSGMCAQILSDNSSEGLDKELNIPAISCLQGVVVWPSCHSNASLCRHTGGASLQNPVGPKDIIRGLRSKRPCSRRRLLAQYRDLQEQKWGGTMTASPG